MTKVSLFVVVFAMVLHSIANGQTYAEQYENCSKLLQTPNIINDSLSFEIKDKLDSCLLGSNAPNFKAITIKGDTIELFKLKGKVVIINFWTTSFTPFIKVMPQLNKLAKHYSGKNVSFISLTPENTKSLNKFLKRHHFEYSTIAECQNIQQQIFKLPNIFPYSIIIDTEGKIYKMWSGIAEDKLGFVRTFRMAIILLLNRAVKNST